MPLTNTRRTPLSVSGFTRGSQRIDLIPSQFTLEPAQRQDVVVRLTCLNQGFVSDSVEFLAGAQTLFFVVNGECE